MQGKKKKKKKGLQRLFRDLKREKEQSKKASDDEYYQYTWADLTIFPYSKYISV